MGPYVTVLSVQREEEERKKAQERWKQRKQEVEKQQAALAAFKQRKAEEAALVSPTGQVLSSHEATAHVARSSACVQWCSWHPNTTVISRHLEQNTRLRATKAGFVLSVEGSGKPKDSNSSSYCRAIFRLTAEPSATVHCPMHDTGSPGKNAATRQFFCISDSQLQCEGSPASGIRTSSLDYVTQSAQARDQM